MPLFMAVSIMLCVSVFCQDNAQYMRCEIPDTVVTDEVFMARIIMRNNGSTTWASGSTPVTLVSQGPTYNKTWGTYFIILGQTNQPISPGTNATFQTKLKAPSMPGYYDFCWQIQRWMSRWDTTTSFFGDRVTGASIYVKQRTETPPSPYTHKDSLLDTSDFEYMGSFKLPSTGHSCSFSRSGLAMRTSGTEKHLLARGGFTNRSNDAYVYEMTIPQLVKITNGDPSACNTATLVRDWGLLDRGTMNGEEIWSNNGFWFDDDSQILYWCHHNDYYTPQHPAFPCIFGTRFNANGTMTHVGAWRIPDEVSQYKGYWGGVTKLSRRFADAYTGGRILGLGFGGTYSICVTASRGPALGAISLPNPLGESLDLMELIEYSDARPAPRCSEYLPANGDYYGSVPFWSTPFPLPWQGWWTYNDECHTGVFIDLPDKKGYIALSTLILGRSGYDYGGYNLDGHVHTAWFFYDVRDLGAVALGTKSIDSVYPASFADVQYPVSVTRNNDSEHMDATGACFDSASRMMYVYVKLDAGRPGSQGSMVHAYRVREGQTGVETTHTALDDKDVVLSASPNPFNAVTHFYYKVPTRMRVKIGVYTMQGGLIQVISDGLKEAGGHNASWNANRVGSGMYCIKFETGTEARIIKVVMVK